MRADGREGDGLCLRLSSTAIGSAAYGHRLQPRQDLSGLVGCFCRRRGLRRRGAGGTGGHGGRWHPRSGPKPPLTGAALRKAILALRCLIAPQQSSLFLQSRYTPWLLWRALAAAERGAKPRCRSSEGPRVGAAVQAAPTMGYRSTGKVSTPPSPSGWVHRHLSCLVLHRWLQVG